MTRALPIILAMALASPAHAFDDFHFGDRAPPSYRSKAKRHHHRPSSPAPRVKGWVVRELRPLPPPAPRPLDRCTGISVVTQGLPAVTENRALERARDAWAAEVSARFATRFMDLRYAKQYLFKCWRASVADNMVKSVRERLKERMGVIEDMSESDKSMSYQCEVAAIPCEPEWHARGGEEVDDEPYVPPPPGKGPLTSRRLWLLRLRMVQ